MENTAVTVSDPPGVNRVQILAGCLALLLGTLIYLSDRPPGATYFVNRYLYMFSIHDRFPDLFGWADRSLASFLHVFSFILITGGIATASRQGHILVAAAWMAVDAGFEIGQYFDAAAVKLVPDWFGQYPVLDAVKSYFRQGSFDPLDLVAIFAGAVAGYGVMRMTRRKTNERKPT
ncbi:MAG: hypothetical protein V1793_18690 [Pseudomonadota bacterium]